ncbi:MAG: sodium/solute symporter [Planctomycetes bacterium]|nr:sodium/solute symporter [Planctomycetota bacterium]
MNQVDLAVVVASLILVVAVGLWASRRQEKTARAYFLASGRMPWWIIGSAFVSTSVSSEQIVGTVGAAYASGMGVANWELWSLPVYTPLIFLFIPIYLRNKIGTVPEFLRRRFGPWCSDIYSWVMLLAYVFIFLVPVLYGGSLAMSELTHWPFHAVLWVMIVLVGLYTIKGGLASVMWTDAAQCLMLLGGGLVLFFLALRYIPGGWSAMVQAAPERFHVYQPPADPNAPFLGLVVGTAGVFLFYQATNQVMIQRVLGARSAWDGVMGIIFAGFINFLRPLVTCFLGLVVYHWIHLMHRAEPLASRDQAFPFALREFAPQWGLRGIIVAGFLAAVMSTVSALANSTATIFSLDVYRKLIEPAASDRRMVTVGRIASLVALVVAGLMAPMVARWGGIFQYFQTGVTFLAVPFASVILLGILWKRMNNAGGLFGCAGGVTIAGVVMAAYVWHRAHGGQIHWLYAAGFAQVWIVLGILIVTWRTPPPEPAQWEPFVWRREFLRELDAGAARPWYASIRLWFGLYAVAWITIYLYLW